MAKQRQEARMLLSQHLHIKTRYGRVLTAHEIRAYKTLRKVIKLDAEAARGSKDGYSPFAQHWFSYFKESDARLLTNVLAA